jgi:hypothetical protein
MEKSKKQQLFDELDSLDNFDKVLVKDLIKKIWGTIDKKIERSFCTTFVNVQKMLPNKMFTRQQGYIVRTT